MAPSVDNASVDPVFDKLLKVVNSRSRGEERFIGERHSIYHVPSFIRNLKPEQFNCEILRLGLYNRDFEYGTPVDKLKLQVLGIFLRHLKSMDPRGWETFRDEITETSRDAQRLQDFYHETPSKPLPSHEVIQSALTIDAVFIIGFYRNDFQDDCRKRRPNFFEDLDDIFTSMSVQNQINVFSADIWLFENQIPLFLLKNIFRMITREHQRKSDNHFNDYIRGITVEFARFHGLPIDPVSSEDRIEFKDDDHLLACLRRMVCRSINRTSPLSWQEKLQNTATSAIDKMWDAWSSVLKPVVDGINFFRFRTSPGGKRRTLPTVSQLQKIGIRVRGVETNAGGIKFVPSMFRYKGILYVPQLMFQERSAKIMLNICIYEQFFQEKIQEGNTFTAYLWILNDLVNTEEDVRALGEGVQPVILGAFLGDNKKVADTINNMMVNFNPLSKKQEELVEHILVWYRSRWRNQLTHFIDRFVKAPWIVISLAAAVMLLSATILQTVYTVLSFYTY